MTNNFYEDIVINSKKNKLKKFSVIALILVCIFSVGVLADLFSTALTTGSFKFSLFNKKSYNIGEQNLYAVTMGVSNDKFKAYTIASGATSLGAGGYVWFEDNKYTVIANVYQNSEDANKILNNINKTEYETKVIEIKFESIDIDSFAMENEDKKLSYDSLNYLFNLYLELYNLSNNIDTKNITYIKASSIVNSYKSDCKIMLGKLNELKSRNTHNFVNNLSAAYVHIIESLDALVYKLLDANQSSAVVKYTEIEVVYYLNNFYKNM